jgi:hypothetical protein
MAEKGQTAVKVSPQAVAAQRDQDLLMKCWKTGRGGILE